MSMDYQKFIMGDPLKCVVRIKKSPNTRCEEVRIIGDKLTVVDSNNRKSYGPQISFQDIFENSFRPYLSPFIQGFSCNFFAFGSSGSGKTQSIEGTRQDPGASFLFSDSLFTLLETKKYQANSKKAEIQNYSYGVRVRYIEVLDEEVSDLVAKSGNQGNLHIVESIWEGPAVQNVTWITVSSADQITEVITRGQRNKNNLTNEFGKLSQKASTIFTIELLQTAEVVNSGESSIMISRASFFDLPANDILSENIEQIKIRQGSSLNHSIMSLGSILKDLSKKNDYILYEASVLTHLMKDVLGGNSLAVGLFCVKQDDGKGASLTFNYLNYTKNIFNFGIVNDSKAIGLLKKYRAELNSTKNSTAAQLPQSSQQNWNQERQREGEDEKLIELEQKLIENHLEKMKYAEDKQKLALKLSETRERYNLLVKEKCDLQGELIQAEEEKLEISKALIDLQIENTRLLELIQKERNDSINKQDVTQGLSSLNFADEKLVKELQERLKDIVQEKRELELEFLALKKNYILQNQSIETEKLKNQTLSLELINIVNENKELHNQINDMYKKTGRQGDENSQYVYKIEKLEGDNQEQREALVFAKAEIERFKTEMLKFDIMEQQHKLQLDNKKLSIEKGFIQIQKEKQNEFQQLNFQAESSIQDIQNQKISWDSQRLELLHKNKLGIRKIAEIEEKYSDAIRTLEEIQSENRDLHLQLEEKTYVFRNKLVQYTSDQANGGGKYRAGYDLNAREELIRTFNEKEVELNEKLEREKIKNKEKELENKGLKQWARQIKYLAEDWAPLGVPFPEILVKDPPSRLDDIQISLGDGSQQEFDRLRRRNRKLEEDLRIVQEQLQNRAIKTNQDESDINKRLMSEIEQIKGNPSILKRPCSTHEQDTDQIRNERNELQEENRRLVQMLKDGKKWDIYLLQRDNQRLVETLKDQQGENSGTGREGQDKNLKTKLQYYEKHLKTMEKERSELLVRATMAEEQLKAMQEHMNKTTLDYQKKIVELRKNVR